MKPILSTLLKSLLVGAGYAAALALTNLLLSRSVDAQSLLWSFAGGTVIGLTLGWLATSMPAARTRHMVVWGSVIFFNIASVTIEGRFFAPNLVQGSMIALLLQQLVIAITATWLIVKLFARVDKSTPQAAPRRSWFAWLWRFLPRSSSSSWWSWSSAPNRR